MYRKLIRDIFGIFNRNLLYLYDITNNKLCKKLSVNNSFPGGYKRIYNFHIRKTGGTSLNHLFIDSGHSNLTNPYDHLPKNPQMRLVLNSKVIVGWNKKLLEEGNYYYGFSHIPFHEIEMVSA